MVQPKQLKIIDLSAQFLALTLPWAYFLFTLHENEYIHLEHFILSCLIIGTCQLVSYLINRFYLPVSFRVKGRKWYELALLLILAMIAIAVLMKASALALILLFYISPVMILGYFVITVAELLKTFEQ